MELSEFKEIIENGKNEKDGVILEVLEELGYSREEAVEIMAVYLQELTANLSSSTDVLKTTLSQDMEKAVKEVVDISIDRDIDPIKILEKVELRYKSHKRHKKAIEKVYKETESWGAVFSSCVYADDPEANEAFINFLEETYKTKIKDVKQLQDLTGITTLYNYWDKEKGFLIDEEAEKLAKENDKPLESYRATDKQSKDEAIKQLEDTLISSRYSKYTRALETIIDTGGKYKDLLAVDPKDYDLPKSWNSPACLGTDKQSSILWAIKMRLLDHSSGLVLHPGLREIANELEAPYSVLMEAHNLG